MSEKSVEPKLTKKEETAIAEQLASFFFGYWEARNNPSGTNSIRNGEAIVLASGLSKNFPDSPKAMA